MRLLRSIIQLVVSLYAGQAGATATAGRGRGRGCQPYLILQKDPFNDSYKLIERFKDSFMDFYTDLISVIYLYAIHKYVHNYLVLMWNESH